MGDVSPPEPQGYSRALGWELLAKNLLDAWRETDGTMISPELYFALTNIEMFTQQPKHKDSSDAQPLAKDEIEKIHCRVSHPHSGHMHTVADDRIFQAWCVGSRAE